MEITPDTKISALLDAFPELEAVLIAQAPVFAKLKNPVLRKTIGKVATLEKAASMAGISGRDLVRALRAAAGQTVDDDDGTVAMDDADATSGGGVPDWFDEDRIVETVDADALLAEGQVPLGLIMERAQQLSPGQILRVTIAFRPAPIFGMLTEQGFGHYCRDAAAGGYELFVAMK